jgi:hypothetical protein
MFHDHLNPYIATEHARARMVELESSITRRPTVREAGGARRRRRQWLARWTVGHLSGSGHASVDAGDAVMDPASRRCSLGSQLVSMRGSARSASRR